MHKYVLFLFVSFLAILQTGCYKYDGPLDYILSLPTTKQSLTAMQVAPQNCKDLPCFTQALGKPDKTYTETKEDGSILSVYEWKAWVRRYRSTSSLEQNMGSDEYEGYDETCNFIVRFDVSDVLVNYSYIGKGCFTASGKMYDENTWFPTEE